MLLGKLFRGPANSGRWEMVALIKETKGKREPRGKQMLVYFDPGDGNTSADMVATMLGMKL